MFLLNLLKLLKTRKNTSKKGGIKVLFPEFLKFILLAQVLAQVFFFSMSYQVFYSSCGLEITCLSVIFFSVQLQDYTYY